MILYATGVVSVWILMYWKETETSGWLLDVGGLYCRVAHQIGEAGVSVDSSASILPSC